jgi:hypothetical protein
LIASHCCARRDITVKIVVPTAGRRDVSGAGKLGIGFGSAEGDAGIVAERARPRKGASFGEDGSAGRLCR